MASYNWQLTNLCAQTAGAPSGLFTEAEGSLEIDESWSIEFGAGGRVVVTPGTVMAALSFNPIGIAGATLQKWFPTSAGVQVASFPEFLACIDDGVNGGQFLLDDTQPGGAAISITQAPDSILKCVLEVNVPTIDGQAAGTDTPAYLSLGAYGINHITAQIGGADAGILDWTLVNGLGSTMRNPMDTKVAGVKRLANRYDIDSYFPRFTATMEDFHVAATSMFADAPPLYEIIIAMDNGTETDTITMTNWRLSGPTLNLIAQDLVDFPYEFIPNSGTVYDRVIWS